MKKIFLIVASCIMVLIIALLITTNFIFITEKIYSKNPTSINIYKNSVVSLNSKTYQEEDSEYKKIINQLNDVGKISIFERLINNVAVNNKIEQSGDDEYTDSVADVKKNNICIEFIYELKQDKILYVGENTKVISYDKLLFVLSTNIGIDTVLIYYADGSNGYDKFNPLLMNGKCENIINYINTL